MPRPIVAPDKRRRIAQACDNCKRRKERCDGSRPCSICIRRGRESECHFSETPARFLRPQNDVNNNIGSPEGVSQASPSGHTARNRGESDASLPPPPLQNYVVPAGTPSLGAISNASPASVTLSGNLSDTSQAEMAIDRILNDSVDQRGARAIADSGSRPESVAPVPRLARLLRDTHGKFMYVGDSASLSFVQSVRRMVVSAIGDCDFTNDPLRHQIIETTPPTSARLPEMSPLVLDHEECQRLSRHYLLATSGLVDLFDIDTYFRNLDHWVVDQTRDNDIKSSIFYMVLAIGAQVSSEDGDQTLAEKYFNRGRHLAVMTSTDAPSLLTIQAYLCITMYMLGACRRNAAFMQFGIAVRAAFALGMHKSSTHALFDETEAGARRRIWRSVRVLDIFLSASLGRPPATSDLSMERDKGVIDEAAQDMTSADPFSNKVLALCDIFERIIIDVYMKKAVSTRLADSISGQYRDWTSDLPESLQLAKLDSGEDDPGKLSKVLAASYIISSYHWSIILLTRPFLTFQIIKDMGRAGQNLDMNVQVDQSSIRTYADACVDSSLRCLNIAQSLMRYSSLPHRLPFIINSVCNSALVLGAATFADQDKFFPLEDGLKQAIHILNRFAQWDPHAFRYAQIITYLQDATTNYIRQRSQQSMESRRSNVIRLFGTIGEQEAGAEQTLSADQTQTPGLTPSVSDIGISDSVQDVNIDPSLYTRSDLMTDLYSLTNNNNNQDVLPGLVEGGFYSQGQAGAGDLPDGSSYPDDAYYFMDQDLSMFGFC
ncbi:hypothetical protein D6C86_07184 [Aureobasidium pullulans]|uniref:Zn(2)-C6 fungal-type domain-containing protein n=1 Tax=Aureobasidium pullulans TaxID=5580 RepID=A0A4S9VXT9_AURPU|nr:hypothetical protein D6C94_08623 [Aureobasidium pullulans]THZ38060.1 hypothetical protein D6C87_08066 [Aureobasidium pullulans]THZ57320.1 hypothetical protein D6C86_07184 [Aureobasidium pullulans]